MASIQDLLPIPKGTEAPNAYDVFGLRAGEQDMDTVTKAVVSVVENLKLVKEQSDLELWNQAARMVDQARQILADPARKSALDSKLQLVSSTAASAQSGDPLAGLLPDGDPLDLVGKNAVGGNTVSGHSGRAKNGSIELSSRPSGAASQAPMPNQVLIADQPSGPTSRQRTGGRRRRGSSAGKWMLGLMLLALVGTSGLLTYFVMFGQSPAQTASSENQIAVGTKQIYRSENADSDPAKSDLETPLDSRDPVMGDLAANTPDTRSDTFGKPSGIVSGIPAEEPEPEASPEPTEMIIEPDSSPTTPAEAAATPTVPVLSESQQQKELDAVRSLIREPNWAEMKVAAETLTEKALSPGIQAHAQGLCELADLASFYRGGIERAVAELEVGSEIEVTDSFRVIVVDKGEDLLVVRFDRKNRSFKFDEFPFSLAHKLATFQVPEGSTRQAAKAAYQAIATKATDAHRDQSIDWLKAIDGEIEGANRDRLIKAIETFYPSAKE